MNFNEFIAPFSPMPSQKGCHPAAGLGVLWDLAGMNGLKIQNQFYWEHMDTYGTFDIYTIGEIRLVYIYIIVIDSLIIICQQILLVIILVGGIPSKPTSISIP